MSPFNFTGINDKPMGAFDRACNQEKLRNERLNVSLVESYVWEPFFCNMVPWDGVKFCQLLGNLNYACDSSISISGSYCSNIEQCHWL